MKQDTGLQPKLNNQPAIQSTLIYKWFSTQHNGIINWVNQHQYEWNRNLMINALCPYLCHLLLALGLGGFSVGIVVSFNEDQVVGLWVNDKSARCVLQRKGHLVKYSTQLFQSQNSVKDSGKAKVKVDVKTCQQCALHISLEHQVQPKQRVSLTTCTKKIFI